MNTCTKCGTPLMPEAKACSNCGQPVVDSKNGSDTFRHAEEEFYRLKGMLDSGRITRQQFETSLHGLMVLDARGRYWNLGAAQGRWHVHDGKAWVPADPYAAAGAPPGIAASSGPPPNAVPPVAVGAGGVSRWLLLALLGALAVIGGGILVGLFNLGAFGAAGTQTPTATLVAIVVPTTTPLPLTATNVPPTATAIPTRTPTTIAATATRIPPTATPAPPTATAIPTLAPTATPPPPTATNTPAPTATNTVVPTATPSEAAKLRAQLDPAWNAGDWQKVVSILEALRILDPADLTVPDKLYAARVNYGMAMLAAGNRLGAAAQCQAALEILPSGIEALQCLAQANPPTATATRVSQPPPPPPSVPTATPTDAPPNLKLYVSVRGYEKWGRPSVVDNWCTNYNDKDPVSRLTIDVTGVNNTAQTLTSWYGTFYNSRGAVLSCYFPYDDTQYLPAIPAGGTKNVTWAGYTDMGVYITEFRIKAFGWTYRFCFAPWDGHLVACQ